MFGASEVKELREKTGAGMLDCKKALDATKGDIEAAVDWLREKGISSAEKKASRIAAEGICQVVEDGNRAVMIEVNCETDFVAKNEEFTKFVDMVAQAILASDATTNEEVLALTVEGQTLSDRLIALTAKLGEKLSFRRFVRIIKKDEETFGSYLHMGGKIGSLVVVGQVSKEVAKDVAMHVAAMSPVCISREDVPADMVERETTVIKEQVMNEGKPEEIAMKMVTGRLNKFYKEVCLLEQAFIKENTMNVETYVKNNGGTVLEMVRFAVGEGIEKKQEDFASEVMNQINQ